MESSPRLRFDRASYSGAPTSLVHCGFCGRGIDALEFEIYGRPACDVCTRTVKAQLPTDDRKTFVRALGFAAMAACGSGLALLGALEVFPSLFRFGAEFFAAWGVGGAIAKAVRVGGRGALGRRYQIGASFLAYAAMVYPLQGFIMGSRDLTWWAFPLVLLQPVGFLFTELRPIGGAELLAASIAMTWTWRGLRGSPSPIRKV